MRFKTFLEATDIFGFESRNRGQDQTPQDELDNKPLRQFDVELMMNYLSRKKVGPHESTSRFMNEIQWGENYGAVKLEVDTGYRFLIKRLTHDLEGSPRWITKKLFQLNRKGFGGYEDSVANEIYDQIKYHAQYPLEGPKQDFDDLSNLATYVATRMRRVAESKFLYEGIKRVTPDTYQIVFGVGGQGVEARNHFKVEQNVTELSYDKEKGTIRITNYNIQSKAGRERNWQVMPSDMDLYFYPSQDKQEIGEAVATRFRYY